MRKRKLYMKWGDFKPNKKYSQRQEKVRLHYNKKKNLISIAKRINRIFQKNNKEKKLKDNIDSLLVSFNNRI